MRNLPKFESEQLIVGLETADDAAVYKINDQQAIIQTLDFFTPVVDDPYTFGQIAASNSLSDVYAMGGVPTLALNICGFPTCIDLEILSEILRGGADKVKEAGAVLVGGHTVEDEEPKYGLSVMGMVHPDEVLMNSTAKEGDVLIITKPLGVGILNTAIKEDLLSEDEIKGLVDTMLYLNKYAAEGMQKVKVNACTDITGFGLIGHAYEMADGSDLSIELYASKIPVLAGAREQAEMGIIPKGAYDNMTYVQDYVTVEDGIEEVVTDIMHDPQTSGGLLVSLPEAEGEKLLAIYEDTLDTPFALVGRVVKKGEKPIIVRK